MASEGIKYDPYYTGRILWGLPKKPKTSGSIQNLLLILYCLELKAKRKKSKEENEAPRGRSTKMKLSMSHSFPKSSNHLHEKNQFLEQSYRSIPLFENGIQFGKKLIPNNRLDYSHGGSISNGSILKANSIKLEVKTECPESDPEDGAQDDDVPLSSILKKNNSDFSCPALEPNVKLEV